MKKHFFCNNEKEQNGTEPQQWYWIQQDYADLTGSAYATQRLGDQRAKFNAFSS
jgi:hypothetical protein